MKALSIKKMAMRAGLSVGRMSMLLNEGRGPRTFRLASCIRCLESVFDEWLATRHSRSGHRSGA